MSLTPSNPRTYVANANLGHRLSSNNSPSPRAPRPLHKWQGIYDSGLSLKRIIGTTVTLPTGFDSLPTERIFAYVAGAAVVVVQLEQDGKYTQRFFRAHPSAVPVLPVHSNATTFSVPITSTPETRSRTIAQRESFISSSPSTPKNLRKTFADSPLSKTWTSRERIKAATCLSLSRDGRFLAVGETGYTPRVLIFNLHESTDIPLVILSEHTFGVTAVAFSPDGRYLATLGTANDGFLFIWAISSNGVARLHASNKCTSFIRGMVWMGKKLITVGTRYVKMWKVDDKQSASPAKQKFAADGAPITPHTFPSTVTRMLSGRNCLLGTLVDSIFTAVASITDKKAVICTEKGDICIVDDNDVQNQLLKVASAGFSVSCVSVDDEKSQIRFGGRCGAMKVMEFEDLIAPTTPPPSPCDEDFDTNEPSVNGNICAMAVVDSYVVTADSRHAIKITKKDESSSEPLVPYTAHCDPVQGVRLLSLPNKFSADFFTWDSAGKVLFWDLEGRCQGTFTVELEQADGAPEDVINHCLAVRASSCGSFFVAGDKYGVLRIIDSSDNSCTFQAKAHNSDIEDIAIYEGKHMTLIATCGRDRTVQLFKKKADGWVFEQTMDEHTGSVNSISFCDDGAKLVTSSSDRTVVVRQVATRELDGVEVTAAVPIRVINVKGTPVSMAISSIDTSPSTLVVVGMMDRTIATFDVNTGKPIGGFKTTDGDGNDPVVMSSIVIGGSTPGKPKILAGVSGTDKSVRIYDGRSGIFLDRGFGHTAAVTDIALIENAEQTMLISTGSDSTIMIWDLTTKTPEIVLTAEPAVFKVDESTPSKELTSNLPPLRKVLSKAELAEFARPTSSSARSGRGSPPQLIRKKSKYNINNNPNTNTPKLNLPAPSVSAHQSSHSDETYNSRRSTRNRSRSPPPSPKSRQRHSDRLLTTSKRASCLDLRGRTKSSDPRSGGSGFGSLNMATEQACRTLRSYRAKLSSTDTVREDLEMELVRELQLTAQAVDMRRERELVIRDRDASKGRKISDTVVASLLDRYSEQLVRVFDEKLRLSVLNSTPEREMQMPTLMSPTPPSATQSAPGSRAGSMSKGSEFTGLDLTGEACADGVALMPRARTGLGLRRKSRTG